MANKETYSKEQLQDLYNQGLTMRAMADFLVCSVGKIHKLFCKYEMQRRSQEEYAKMGRFSVSETRRKELSRKLKGREITEAAKRKMSEAKRGKYRNPSEFGGHSKKHRRGYIMVYTPTHPHATRDGYVFEHILVFENYYNCIVNRATHVVHHINENKQDNRIENLKLMTKEEHMSFHSKQRHKKEKEL